MIEDLLNWEVRSRSLARLGRQVEDINMEFCLLDISLADGYLGGVVNMNRKNSLLKKIQYLRNKADKITIRGRDRQAAFDKLVLENLDQSLFAQQEYIQFFFTYKYNKEYGVSDFLNYTFLPRKQFEKNEKNGAINFLESELRGINYRAITKRENLMKDIMLFGISANPGEFEDTLLEQIPRLRKIIGDYNINMGFETEEQVNMQHDLAKQREIEKIKEKMRSLFGPYKGDIPDVILAGIDRELGTFKRKVSPLDQTMNDLIYDLVLTHEDSCAWDSSTKTMEVNSERFYFYKDKKGRTKFYSGDLLRSVGHENYHRFQTYFSRFMPPGLREVPGVYSLTSRTIEEGVATILEDNFMRWLEENRKKYQISKKDIETAKLFGDYYFASRIPRLMHSIYHREETPIGELRKGKEERAEHYAHMRLARIARVPVFADDDYLINESLPETYYFAFYLFGKKYVNETLSELEQKEKIRLGSLRSARRFLKRNEPIVLQGLLTGQWGWSTHKDFFLKHYWPKARKYCN